jgi:hypothetical protein
MKHNDGVLEKISEHFSENVELIEVCGAVTESEEFYASHNG